MAATQSPDASEIRRRGRQRLIGAVAIALLLIVFVPMLLDSEPRPAHEEPKLDIPPRENAPPLPAPPPKVEPKVTPAPAPAVEEPMKPVAKVEPAPAKPAPTPAAPAKAEGFAIQVGAFADEAK